MKVLITAGTVYGKLDDNKLVGNRIRGIWATKFGQYLINYGHEVTLLVPDTFDLKSINEYISDPSGDNFTLVKHDGYFAYAERCYELAPKMDAAVMAAAVVNWIPAEPIKGKMKTEGYAEGDVIQIPFMLAPRVIDRMRKLNPKLTLVGCKMTSGSPPVETLRAAYGTLLKAHCNVVVANDLSDLKKKMLVYPDGHGLQYRADADVCIGDVKGFQQMYGDLNALLNDKFYRTEAETKNKSMADRNIDYACMQFDLLCDQYRERFKKRPEGPDGAERVFGSLAVRIDADHVLMSPREKGGMFGSTNAVIVTRADPKEQVVFTVRGHKATLNAPLLLRVMDAFKANAVVHLHEEKPEWPSYPYAPPGTARDNDRLFTERAFNIEGHGCVFVP